MNLSQAKAIVGAIGFPSKMPGTSYGLPAKACIAGSALAKLPGSICSQCYALAGSAKYQMPRAMIGQERRLEAVARHDWVDAMVRLLLHLHLGPIKVDLGIAGERLRRAGGVRFRWNEPGFHRWHDSGDLQSVEHLEKIIEVCRRTPQIRHWLPTRELAMLRACKAPIPDNLTIRVSAAMIDGMAPMGWAASTVHTASPPVDAHECPAPRQGHMCGLCRACWSRDIALVSYALH
jgi:hypothetical protein